MDYEETKFEPKNATDEKTVHDVDKIQKMFGLPVQGREDETQGNKKSIEEHRKELGLGQKVDESKFPKERIQPTTYNIGKQQERV